MFAKYTLFNSFFKKVFCKKQINRVLWWCYHANIYLFKLYIKEVIYIQRLRFVLAFKHKKTNVLCKSKKVIYYRNKTFGRGKKGADNKGKTKRPPNKKGAGKKGAEQKWRRAKRAQNKKGARSRCCVTVTFKVVISSDNRVLSQSFFFFFFL